MMPIADSSPLMTLDGKNAASAPAFSMPSPICIAPASTTATRNASKEPSVSIWLATMAVRPAAGPLMLVCEPLSHATSIPPTTPATIPETSGAPEASATPRHRGSATRKTTTPAEMSWGRVFR